MKYRPYPAYKDSGVEWLGEVPEHWVELSIKRRYKVIGGSTPKSDDPAFWDGEILWVTPADLSRLQGFGITSSLRKITMEGLRSCGTELVPSGTVVLSTRAPIGSLGIAAAELCTNQGCKSLIPQNGENSRFLAFLLSVATDELNIRGRGTTFLELSANELGAFKVALPSPVEQNVIVTFLDRETAKLDTLIAKQEKLIELLQEKRQALISHAMTKGLNPDVPMKNSGVEWLGEVPKHWEILSISSISTKITNGYVGPTRDILVEGGVRYLQSLHIKGNEINFHTPYFVTEAWSQKHRKSILETGDVLIVQTGDIGQVAVVPDEYSGCNCHALIIVSPLKGTIEGTWLSWVLNSTYGFHSLLSIQTGALHPHLNCGNVKDLRRH